VGGPWQADINDVLGLGPDTIRFRFSTESKTSAAVDLQMYRPRARFRGQRVMIPKNVAERGAKMY